MEIETHPEEELLEDIVKNEAEVYAQLGRDAIFGENYLIELLQSYTRNQTIDTDKARNEIHAMTPKYLVEVLDTTQKLRFSNGNEERYYAPTSASQDRLLNPRTPSSQLANLPPH